MTSPYRMETDSGRFLTLRRVSNRNGGRSYKSSWQVDCSLGDGVRLRKQYRSERSAIAFANRLLADLPDRQPNIEYKRKLSKRLFNGYVYLIRSTDANRTKIGFSINPGKRLGGILTSDPSAYLLAYGGGRPSLERDLHKRFTDKRIIREWFDLTPMDIRSIIELDNWTIHEDREGILKL